MLEKPVGKIYPIIYYIGAVILSLAATQLIPLLTAVFCAEWRISLIFLFTLSVAASVGAIGLLVGYKHHSVKLNWGEGMAIASGAWLIGMLLCALPYYISGSYLSFLDACFDVMSGLTTTGVMMIQDVDHLSNGLNMWRFILTFIGGQGMVVLALTFLTKDTAGAYKLYAGEAKDERLMPNAVSTAKNIWYISLLYLVIGTVSMFIAGLVAGLPAPRAFLHGMWIYMSAWSTGGFAPMSQNILYYHSAVYEIATVVFFVLGSFNFALHYSVLTGKRKELRKNIETVSFSITMTVLFLITAYGLMKNNVYPDIAALFRKGFYQLASGHTTTGFMSVYAKQFYYEWGDIALFGIIIAMLFGGSACST
ncbi:MAG: potassium transporter TrkG, partial [Oscillospiraceae bacterium]